MKGIRATALLSASLALAAAEGPVPLQLQSELRYRPMIDPRTARVEPGFTSYDGSFHFCRVWFRNGLIAVDGDGWFVDYPRADMNLSIRLAELTKTPVTHDPEGGPDHQLVRLTDPELFQCPFVMMSEPGGSFFDASEAANLRKYLLKGGFLWVDDFWGDVAWRNWETQLRKALPESEFPIVDLAIDHPMFHTVFDLETLRQTPNIGLWVRAGQTSERGPLSAQMHVRAILDDHGRVIVYMTHNTDFGDAYERESDSPDYFQHFSVNGYAMGIDVLLYAMTH